MMNGLFGSSMDDPKTLATLQLVGGLLSAPRFGQGLSQGLMGYSDTLMRAKQQQAAEQMNRMRLEQMQLQMEQQRAQAEQQNRDRTAMQQQFQPLPGPSMDGGPVLPRFDPSSMLGQGASPDAVMQALQLQQAMSPAAQKPLVLSEGQVALGPDMKPIASNPKQAAPEKDPEAIRVLKLIYGEGTPAYFQALQRLGQKTTEHAPGVNVSFGTPMPAVNPKTGEVELMRPDNKGGMNFTGIKPPPQDRDVKLPAELQRMQIAGDAMETLMGEYEELLKKHNPRDPVTALNPTVRANMQSIKRNIELQFKELQALGALAGPDIDIMRQALADPFSVQGAYFGREGLLAQVRQARNLVKIRKDAVLNSQGRKPAVPASGASSPVVDFGNLK